MTINWPSNTTDIIDQIRDTIGRPVVFYVQSDPTECEYCSLDPTTGLSTDPFCPVCSGEYYLYTTIYTTITGHVRWVTGDDLAWVSGGQYYIGENSVQIKYTQQNLDTIRNSKYVKVDNKLMYIDNVALRGVPDVNRIIVTLAEEEKDA